MGWRSGKTIYIAPGQIVRIDFWWKAPGDKGAQWAMGHPKSGEYGTLATERVGKKARCSLGKLTINGPASYSCGDPETAYWRYFAEIRNLDTGGCHFQLEGGGV